MRPITVITLVILGSCVAITVSLAAVLIVMLVLGDEYPRLQTEFDAALHSLGLFAVMTVISLLSFYSLLINHDFRYWAQAGMWVGLLLTGWYYAS
jgi:hypothetical protein